MASADHSLELKVKLPARPWGIMNGSAMRVVHSCCLRVDCEPYQPDISDSNHYKQFKVDWYKSTLNYYAHVAHIHVQHGRRSGVSERTGVSGRTRYEWSLANGHWKFYHAQSLRPVEGEDVFDVVDVMDAVDVFHAAVWDYVRRRRDSKEHSDVTEEG